MFIEFQLAFFEPSTWSNMFTLGDSVTWPEKILRPMIVYVSLIVLLRIVGKRELAQLNPLDLVVILSLSNTVQNAIIGDDTSVVGGIVGAAALLLINAAVAYLKYRAEGVEALVEGMPVVLIENGELNEKVLKRELLTKSDLDIVAHENGLDDAGDIEKLVLDPNGSFLVEPRDEMREARFRREVLRKIGDLSKQLTELNAALHKS